MPRGRVKGSKREVRPQIVDEILEPFYIKIEDSSFSILKRGEVQPWGYYSHLGNALDKIAKFKLANSTVKSFSLQGYISQLEKLSNTIKSTIKF